MPTNVVSATGQATVKTVGELLRPQRSAASPAQIERSWLECLITRRVPMSGFADALHKHDAYVGSARSRRLL